MGKRDPLSALAAIEDARPRLGAADFVQLRSLQAQAELGSKKLPPRPPVLAPSLDCWENVMFKQSIMIVDCNGGGHFVSLHECIMYESTKPTSIIVLPGHYEVHRQPKLVFQQQILGEGTVSILKCEQQAVTTYEGEAEMSLLG